MIGVSPNPEDAPKITTWTKSYWEALHRLRPHSAGAAYVNMMMDEGDERIRASYRGNYERLVAAKHGSTQATCVASTRKLARADAAWERVCRVNA